MGGRRPWSSTVSAPQSAIRRRSSCATFASLAGGFSEKGVSEPTRVGKRPRSPGHGRRRRSPRGTATRRHNRRGTAGNTGIALALVANERGYNSLSVVSDDQSFGKIDLLRTCASEVRVVAAVPFTNPENYYHVARRIAEGAARRVLPATATNASIRPPYWSLPGGDLGTLNKADGKTRLINQPQQPGIDASSRILKRRDGRTLKACALTFGSWNFSEIAAGSSATPGSDSATVQGS
jgi:hypothetical protein